MNTLTIANGETLTHPCRGPCDGSRYCGQKWVGAALSLCYDFTIIPNPRPGQPWCEVQGQVNGNVFLSYHCGSEKLKPIGHLGLKVNNIDAWERQSEALKDLVEELRKKLLDIKPEISTTSDPVTLQGKMLCPYKANGCSSGSWLFEACDSENENCTVFDPGERLLKETLDNDREMSMFLRKISNGDCRSWLEQFLVHWEKLPETTASPTMAPATAQSRAMAITPIAWILLVTVLTSSLLLGLLG
nr:PREDICTED: NKG2D ligand 1-like [Equus przewalskii]